MANNLVMYSRTFGCPFISLAKRVLADNAVPYREIMIDKDSAAKQRVLEWTGFLSVPTIIVAADESDLPIETPSSIEPGTSPRGIDRGTMITEPNIEDLLTFLKRHGFVEQQADAQLDAF